MESFVSLGDYLKREKELESLNCSEVPESLRNSDIDVSTLSTNHSKHAALLAAESLHKFETNKKEMDLYMDKTGTEIQWPKMIVCFQKDAYQVVKEFCIDVGMQHGDKYVQEHNDEQNKLFKSFDYSESLYVIGHPNIDANKKNHINTGGEETENVTDNICEEYDNAKYVLQKQELDDNRTPIVSSDFLLIKDKGKIAPNGDTREIYFTCSGGMKRSIQDLTGKNTSSTTSQYYPEMSDGGETSAIVLSDCCISKDSLVKSSVGVAATPTSCENLDQMSLKEDQPELISIQSVSEQDSTDSTIVSRHLHSQCSHQCQAESHLLCAAGSLSADRINCTEQMVYSGSISLRSDGSTTSTCSFAFPILQTEWNSSPIRMARADNKQYRRQRGWRVGLFCCRFF